MTFIFIVALFVIIGVLLIRYGKKTRQKWITFLTSFAAQKSLTYSPNPVTLDLIDPSMFVHPSVLSAFGVNVGGANSNQLFQKTQVKVSDEMKSRMGRSVFFTKVVWHSGKNQQSQSLLVAKQAVISQANFVFIPNIGERLLNTQGLSKLELESTDINAIFKLFVVDGSQVDALTILTPDKLLWLAQVAPNAMIVCKPGVCYVMLLDITSYKAASNTQYSYAYQYQLINSVCDRLTGIASDIVNNPVQAASQDAEPTTFTPATPT